MAQGPAQTAGKDGAMKVPSNVQLVDYGIQNEESDIRAHVAVYAQKVYIYRTEIGQAVIKRRPPYRLASVYTAGIKTAEGYLVPTRNIDGCQGYAIPDNVFTTSGIGQLPERGYQGQKGKAATYIVHQMLQLGLVPVPVTVTEVNDQSMQIQGIDIQTRANVNIQIKCDYRAGNGTHPRCTGNLFLQIRECNPFQIH